MNTHSASHDDHAGHDHAGHDHADHAHADHGGIGKYIAVFVALCVLSSASFATLYWPFSKHTAWAFMMAVSCGKALLVVLFFMHVKYEASWKYVLTIPATIMAVFLGLALVPDIGLRQRQYSEERALQAAEPAAPAAADAHAGH